MSAARPQSNRSGTWRTRFALALAPFALATPGGDVTELVERLRDKDPRVVERAREELSKLDTRSAPELVGLIGGRIGDVGLLAEAERQLLLATLRSWPADKAVSALVDALPSEPTLDDRLVILRLIAEVGGRTTLDAVESLCAGMSEQDEAHPLVDEVVEETLASALRRDGRTYDEVRRRIDRGSLPLPLARRIAPALGSVGLGRGFSELKRLLGRGLELDLVVLEALGNLRPFDQPEAAADTARTLRSFLSSPDAESRRRAALSLGVLADGESTPELLDLLMDSDRRVQRGASVALSRISGLRAGETSEAWRHWYEGELAWLESQGEALIEDLSAEDPARVVAALRILSMHPVHRSALAAALFPLLEHPNDLIAVAACAALAKLHDATAFPHLLATLEDERETVRGAAGHALTALTGAEFGTDPAAWLAWLCTDAP